MQTLVELPPTASSQVASRNSTASCRYLLGNLWLLVQTRPSGPGAKRRTGFSLSQSCFSLSPSCSVQDVRHGRQASQEDP